MQKPNDDEVVLAVWPRYVRWRKVDELAGNVKKKRAQIIQKPARSFNVCLLARATIPNLTPRYDYVFAQFLRGCLADYHHGLAHSHSMLYNNNDCSKKHIDRERELTAVVVERVDLQHDDDNIG